MDRHEAVPVPRCSTSRVRSWRCCRTGRAMRGSKQRLPPRSVLWLQAGGYPLHRNRASPLRPNARNVRGRGTRTTTDKTPTHARVFGRHHRLPDRALLRHGKPTSDYQRTPRPAARRELEPTGNPAAASWWRRTSVIPTDAPEFRDLHRYFLQRHSAPLRYQSTTRACDRLRHVSAGSSGRKSPQRADFIIPRTRNENRPSARSLRLFGASFGYGLGPYRITFTKNLATANIKRITPRHQPRHPGAAHLGRRFRPCVKCRRLRRRRLER